MNSFYFDTGIYYFDTFYKITIICQTMKTKLFLYDLCFSRVFLCFGTFFASFISMINITNMINVIVVNDN